jgi:hypothetical protein
MAQQIAAAMKAATQSQQHSLPADYAVTDRSESVDGRACRVWEEREGGATRVEFCVTSTQSVPGGPEILAGIKALCQYYHGSLFALGVEFGMRNPWPAIEKFHGVPILIREFRGGRAVTETRLSHMRPGLSPGSFLDVPAGYPVHARPVH